MEKFGLPAVFFFFSSKKGSPAASFKRVRQVFFVCYPVGWGVFFPTPLLPIGHDEPLPPGEARGE